MNRIFQSLLGLVILTCVACKQQTDTKISTSLNYLNNSQNILDFGISPKHKYDRDGLMYSDQGAWFAYGLQDSTQDVIGFSGPFLMTQQNGTWSSRNLTGLKITNQKLELNSTRSFNSHLEQLFKNTEISVAQYLTYISGHTAIVKSEITNTSDTNLELQINWGNQPILADSLSLTSNKNELTICTFHLYFIKTI